MGTPGYGLGDLIAVTQIALRSYNAYKSAEEDVRDLSEVLNSLKIEVEDVENIPESSLTPSQIARRKQLLKGCYSVVEELKSLLKKYQCLNPNSSKGHSKKSKKRSVWEKFNWIKEDPTGLRNKLITNTDSLHSFYLQWQYTNMTEMRNMQIASQLQIMSLQTIVQQHFGRPSGLNRRDTAASLASVASFAVREAGGNLNARNPWRNFCQELHDRGVSIRPEDITDQFMTQVTSAILQNGNRHSSCETTVSVENQPRVTLSGSLLDCGSPSVPNPRPKTSTLLCTANMQMNQVAISSGEAGPHSPVEVETPSPKIKRTTTFRVNEISVCSGNSGSGASTLLETFPETHTFVRSTSFQVDEYSISDPIDSLSHNAQPQKHGRTASFKISISQSSVGVQDYTFVEETPSADHQDLTNGIMNLLAPNTKAHTPRRLDLIPADRMINNESGVSSLNPIVEIFGEDDSQPMVTGLLNVECSGPEWLDLDRNCGKEQVAALEPQDSMSAEPLSLAPCLPSLQELEFQERENSLDDSLGQQQMVVKVFDTCCNGNKPSLGGPDADLAVVTMIRAADTITPEANEDHTPTNPSEAHTTQDEEEEDHSQVISTAVTNAVTSSSGEREALTPRDCAGTTPFKYDKSLGEELHDAVQKNRMRAVAWLLETGANANAEAPDFGNVLNFAVFSNYLEIAKLLLRHGADVRGTIKNHKRNNNNTQFTALYHAVSWGYYEMVKLLLNELKKLDDIDLVEITTRALQFALWRETPAQCRVMQLLLEYHADVNACDSRGSTLLDRAISFGSHGAIKVLLEGGVNINAQDRKGRTALHRLLVDTDELQRLVTDVEEITGYLLEHGADPFLEDSHGESAYDVANRICHDAPYSIRCSAAVILKHSKDRKRSIHASHKSKTQNKSPSLIIEPTDNPTPESSPTTTEGPQNDPIFKFAAQCFIDILTQMQIKRQQHATVDEKSPPTKFNIDTKEEDSTFVFECTIITSPSEVTSTMDSTSKADPLPHSTGGAVSSSCPTGEATPAPLSSTLDFNCAPKHPFTQPEDTESKFRATFILGTPVSANEEKVGNLIPSVNGPMANMQSKQNPACNEVQFPISLQMSMLSENGVYQGSCDNIDIQKIIDANLVFLHNPEDDLRVGPWLGVY